jgi:hypothetical protein
MKLKSNAKWNVMTKTKLVYMLLCVVFLGCGIQQTRAGAFTASGSTLTLDLDVASQWVSVVSKSRIFPQISLLSTINNKSAHVIILNKPKSNF